ncbi:MAG: hypothetical protein AAF800_14500 [Planctomycetota bacterium]
MSLAPRTQADAEPPSSNRIDLLAITDVAVDESKVAVELHVAQDFDGRLQVQQQPAALLDSVFNYNGSRASRSGPYTKTAATTSSKTIRRTSTDGGGISAGRSAGSPVA